jgi:hypothetical protein
VTTIFKAELRTHHFHFEALGDSVEAAREALIKGLITHGHQYRVPASWWGEYVDELVVTQFELNAPALRDGEEMIGKGSTSRVVQGPKAAPHH